MLLGSLPAEKAKWPETVANSRRLYSQLRSMVVVDPRKATDDPTLVNPLSQIDDVRSHSNLP